MSPARAKARAVTIAWSPAWHAKWLERATLPLGLVARAKRVALEALLTRNRPEDRVDRAFAPPFSPSRYTDGSHAAFYVAKDARTAFFEKLYHDAGQLRRHGVGRHPHAIELLQVRVGAVVHDIRALAAREPALRDRSDYSACQKLARERVSRGAQGLLYPSVRDEGADCAVIFVRRAIISARAFRSFTVEWDGSEFILDRAAEDEIVRTKDKL